MSAEQAINAGLTTCFFPAVARMGNKPADPAGLFIALPSIVRPLS